MNTAQKQQPVQANGNKCAECRFSALCLPSGLDLETAAALDGIVRRHRIQRDARLYRIGHPFTSLYAVHFGHFKTTQVDRRGAQQVTGFAMSGDVLGFDAIAGGRHACDAVALEDSEVCEIPFDRLQELFCKHPQLLQRFHFLMSQEIQREQGVMLVLGNLRAEQRFACFLLNLSARYAQRGYSPTSFQLRMSRDDIGGYLGLTIESVSRLVAKFRNNGWIRLDNRKLDILDRASLEALAAGLRAGERAAHPADPEGPPEPPRRRSIALRVAA
ncbi:MAG TPA: helix-turn-helix domain-containing protein [Telluria sp.]|nr:helix-turn-helix domain-containing protein [Telluria sp.]